MMFEFAITLFAEAFGIVYKWLDHDLVAYFLNFAKAFEFAIIIIAAILFLLFNVFLIIKHLPPIELFSIL
jgi:hypothetical protein